MGVKMEQSLMLSILTKGLPGAVTHPLYLEYNSRKREVDNVLARYDNYKVLRDYSSTINALLSMCLFYRHVMGHMQGATSFYTSVNKGNEKECPIKIGSFLFDKKQQGHLWSAVIKFNQIQDKYQLSPKFFEFSETIQFLRNCKELFEIKEHEEDDTV
jgi:hypothetical protein